MNKSELIEKIAADAGVSKADAKRVLDSFTKVVADALRKGDQVSLIGFGRFSIKKRSARTGRNPQTGKKIQIASAKVPSFKPGKILKKTVDDDGHG